MGETTDGDRSMAWFCAYTPLELLDAAGLLPERRFGDPLSIESADTFLHPAVCPYVRACLAAEIERDGPHHAVFVNSCDGMRRLYDAWSHRFHDDFVYLMDLPRNPGIAGERLLRHEFHRLARSLEEFTGVGMSAGRLIEAALEREGRRLAYLQAAKGVSGKARICLAMESQSSRSGVKPASPVKRGASGGVAVSLTGNLLNPDGLVSSLEEAGARVVWIDLCNGDRAFASSTLPQGNDLDGLLASLARKYLDRNPCARMKDSGRRNDLLVDATRETRARGVVYASLKFCDSYLYDFPRVRERLDREGIPVLHLESDYADGHGGQLLTRMEAFLEML